MNRVLKYRAYDKINNRMWYSNEIAESENNRGFFMNFNDKGELEFFTLGKDPYDEFNGYLKELLPKMEFTGLLDKNGTEIYEYDIIKTYSRHPETSKWYREPEIQIVRWNPHNAMFAAFHDMDEIKDSAFGNGTYIHKMNYGKWEVIGNIFENPEYLEE